MTNELRTMSIKYISGDRHLQAISRYNKTPDRSPIRITIIHESKSEIRIAGFFC